ncbi:hypothetical protein [Caulobacter sp. 17J65-9]|uniref:hypothetical protein n=1 Tax=Caulobacter sp. 17J65-9 TaxID=2709382 RepID=UPI0013CB9A0A|nr:hypothetical protein [Caulobacter sp. 17J65-9]NEX91608.1 hypothetical protein [Caulobacter sp. 17J65-9]
MRRGLIITLLVMAAAVVLVGGQFVLDDRGTYHVVVAVTVAALCAALWVVGGRSADPRRDAQRRRRKVVWLLVSTALFAGLGVAATYQPDLTAVTGVDSGIVGVFLLFAWLLWSISYLSIFSANLLAYWGLPLFWIVVVFWGPSALQLPALVALPVSAIGSIVLLRCPRCLTRAFKVFRFPISGAPWGETCDGCGLSFHEHSYLDRETQAPSHSAGT